MNEELIRYKEELAALEAFRQSKAYPSYLASRRQELKDIEEEILMSDPVDRSDEIEQFKLRGERRLIEQMMNYFDRAIADVKDSIAELEDQEQEMTAVSPDEDGL
jgi:hypothetical protein